MKFVMTSILGGKNEFTDNTIPSWMNSGVPGSTMDTRWIWQDHVSKLEIGQTFETDFQTIERIE